MPWLVAVLTLAASVMLGWVGASLCARPSCPRYVRWFGLLTISLAALGVVLYGLLFFAAVVLSPEFGVIMVEGQIAAACLKVLVVGVAIVAGLGLHVARTAVDWPTRLPLLAILSLLVGLAGGYRVHVLVEQDVSIRPVYAYDLWWPVLLVWITFCFIESALTTLRLRAGPVRAWAAAFIAAGLSQWALGRGLFADDSSTLLWAVCLTITLPLCIGVATWIALGLFGDAFRLSRRSRWALIVVPAAIGLVGTTIRILPYTEWPRAWIALPLAGLWLAWPLLATGMIVGAFHSGLRSALLEPPTIPRLTPRESFALLALGAVGSCLSVLFSLETLEPAVALTVFIVASLFFAEVIASSPLTALTGFVSAEGLRSPQSPVRRAATVLQAWMTYLSSRITSALQIVFSANSLPVMLLKVLVGIALLVALTEFTNIGKTVVQPFTAAVMPGQSILVLADLPKSDQQLTALGQAVSDRVLNSLGILDHELRADLVVSRASWNLRSSERSTSGNRTTPTDRARGRLTVVAAGTGSIEPVVARSSDLEFGGVKIPLSLLVMPIKVPMRALLGVRVIDGALQIDRRGFVILARATTGETWTVGVEPTLADRAATRDIDSLADELAFRIMMSISQTGDVTQSWEAFKAFRDGLAHWRLFDAEENLEELSKATDAFRVATWKDPTFALAHYRLGLVLQRDGQPGAAAEAFRTSVQAAPGSISARLALASTLYDFEQHYLQVPAIVPPSSSNSPARASRIHEARALWRQVAYSRDRAVMAADRASARYGLCRHEETVGTPRDGLYRAYYHCKRAAHLYSRVTSAEREAPVIKEAEAFVFHTLGEILTAAQHSFAMEEGAVTPEWNCAPEWGVARGAFSRQALRYFERALALVPSNQDFQCSVALTAFALETPQPLTRLAMSPIAHLKIADNSSREEYKTALGEYEAAIGLDPHMIDALNNYAYTVYSRRLASGSSTEDPDRATESKALERARLAARLAEGSRPDRMKAQVAATLGEVLLSQGQVLEAVEVLKKAEERAPRHSAYDEVRWDLAQAYKCLSIRAQPLETSREKSEHWNQEIKRLWDLIQQHERTREFQPLSGTTPRPTINESLCDRQLPREGDYAAPRTP